MFRFGPVFDDIRGSQQPECAVDAAAGRHGLGRVVLDQVAHVHRVFFEGIALRTQLACSVGFCLEALGLE